MQTHYTLRHASSPQDFKGYDTDRLRQEYLIPEVFAADNVNMCYSMHDRLIVGGAMPAAEALPLPCPPILRAEFFLQRRELGIINVGGDGIVAVDGKDFPLANKEALYVGRGARQVVFISKSHAAPALFYFNSAPAHRDLPAKRITKREAVVLPLGSKEQCNERVVNRMLVQEVVATCQLQMGLTELAVGSVWNTMPPHTHERRMEAYFYFDLQQGQAVCHFMGEPQQTRHLWLGNQQAVISPAWSIHSACATASYSFIWGMAGENLDYADMDTCLVSDLR
jgi:4-deoxy-L-threo-5-hexosulose-uronate ketol-isomerase